jgi:hypothetical protein
MLWRELRPVLSDHNSEPAHLKESAESERTAILRSMLVVKGLESCLSGPIHETPNPSRGGDGKPTGLSDKGKRQKAKGKGQREDKTLSQLLTFAL